ncbi:MAG: hypothetical protein OJK14_13405 [Achromobacter sp.]|uniref:phage upper tail fiber protein n=1 Tax=Achromobacter sp. TaxID=134375 RepID=UPI00258AFD4A|nr:hypothetical protein [Achromobacter sp.]MCW0208090.1 hypothetical protein [Achromobacter sp.]
MAVRRPLVLRADNSVGEIEDGDTLGGRVAVQPITQTDYDALPIAQVDVLYIRMSAPPSGAVWNLWFGTLTEYNAIPVKDPGTAYIVQGA